MIVIRRSTTVGMPSSRQDLHPQECTHAGRTIKKTRQKLPGIKKGKGKTVQCSASAPAALLLPARAGGLHRPHS